MRAPSPALNQGFEDASKITKICPNGDVILLVGPATKIQVASDFLKHTSPVFKAMLDGPMSEGNALRNKSPDSPITISLPEDSAVAMERLLLILYGADDVTLGFKEFYDVIVLADKYGMSERLKHFGYGWVRMEIEGEHPLNPDFEACWEQLVISYMLNDITAFFQISSYLSESVGCLVEWALDVPDQVFGLKLAFTSELLPEDNSVLMNR